MAAKKSVPPARRSAPPPRGAPIPTILVRPGDPHPLIAKMKERKLARVSYTAERNVWDQVTVAWCLVALDREDEAAAVCEAIARNVDYTFHGQYPGVWAPAYEAAVLGLWLAQRRGDTARVAELEAVARTIPGKIPKPRQRAEAIRKDGPEKIAEARAEMQRDRALSLLQAHPLEWLTAELTMPITDVPRELVEKQLGEAIACLRDIVARPR
ncbi:Hypothetical protein A7982_10371 [Minicystis rosea]|nr:Hypothetical protein A7982_10371 [Minicystis rosea]